MNGINTGEKMVLTGATGFLGSHLMAGLLLKGKGVVVLGRAAGGISLRERISRLLAWFGISHLEGLLEYYETDFLKERLGLANDVYTQLCARSLGIIHCASDTSFAEKNRERVMKSNVESLKEILDFGVESKTGCFHFISSAYAAGADTFNCPEAPVNTVQFTNVYEESKAAAEHIVSARCHESGRPYTIIRPSIVYGNSVTGRSLIFNALYYPVRSMQQIRDIYLHDLEHNNGLKSAECGIYINDEGMLYLPVRIFIPHHGNINLIPIDYFTATMLTILEDPAREIYYHITGNNPESMVTLALYTERFLKIIGIEIVVGTPAADEVWNPPEELYHHFLRAYRPYLADRRIFSRENTDRITGGELPPDLSYEIFRRCMDFAVAADWGKSLF